MENIDLSTILNEDPIDDVSQDLLRRGSFVEALYNEIIKLPVTNSFCFGLYGSWGEGKSSILNLLRKELKKNSNIILFEFDPWYLATKEAILKNFLEGLGRNLRLSFPKKLIKSFEKRFRKFYLGVTFLGTGGQLGMEFEEEGLLELKAKINSQIEETRKRLVILIDDIDRLETDEILLVFKLVKLIANFKNTIFVLSFDPKAVENTLKSKNIDIGYIEKIVQKPIPLPKIEQADIDQFLDLALNLVFSELHVNKSRVNTEVEENFPLIYQRHANKLFTTLRSVKRYVNSLCSSLPPVVSEVNLYDFLLLEIIKVFAPKVYHDIYYNWWFYVPQRTSNEIERWLTPLELKNDQEKETIVKEHIEQLLHSEPQKDVFYNLLDSLFPRFSSKEDARQEKRIYSLSFPKYFTLKVPSTELPDSVIEGWILALNADPKKMLPELYWRIKEEKYNTLELFNKLRVFKEKFDSRAVPGLIKSICKLSSEFSREEGRNSESLTAQDLVVDLLKDKIDNSNEIQSILEEVIASSNFDFASGVYILCKRSNKHRPDKKWDVLESVRQTLVDKFKKRFVEPQKDFFLSAEPTYVLLRLLELSSRVESVSPKECSISKYVWWMLDNNPKYLGKILNYYVSRPIGSKRARKSSLRLSELTKDFDIERLYATCKTAYPNVCESEEEKEAVELFCKVYEEAKEKAV